MAGLKRVALGGKRDTGPQHQAISAPSETPCRCLADFYRQELLKHRQCLALQREYYSEVAIHQADDALLRLMEQVEYLCQRDDACEVLSHLLRQFDVVTKLSAWTDPAELH